MPITTTTIIINIIISIGTIVIKIVIDIIITLPDHQGQQLAEQALSPSC